MAGTNEKNDQVSATALMQQQIGLDTAAPNDRNPKGLRIQFQKLGEVDDGNGHSIRYRLLISGAPEKQSYVLGVWRIGVAVKTTPQPVFTNAKGLVMWHPPAGDQEKADLLDRADEIEVDLKAARGELGFWDYDEQGYIIAGSPRRVGDDARRIGTIWRE